MTDTTTTTTTVPGLDKEEAGERGKGLVSLLSQMEAGHHLEEMGDLGEGTYNRMFGTYIGRLRAYSQGISGQFSLGIDPFHSLGGEFLELEALSPELTGPHPDIRLLDGPCTIDIAQYGLDLSMSHLSLLEFQLGLVVNGGWDGRGFRLIRGRHGRETLDGRAHFRAQVGLELAVGLADLSDILHDLGHALRAIGNGPTEGQGRSTLVAQKRIFLGRRGCIQVGLTHPSWFGMVLLIGIESVFHVQLHAAAALLERPAFQHRPLEAGISQRHLH
eukprot:TCALIF_04800-PA protein Name:"Protein of unknown function" AED:0.93 eAED:0.93 QI:0/0/0/0.25/1/1/4/0/273